jgi:hypothetical protein
MAAYRFVAETEVLSSMNRRCESSHSDLHSRLSFRQASPIVNRSLLLCASLREVRSIFDATKGTNDALFFSFS